MFARPSDGTRLADRQPCRQPFEAESATTFQADPLHPNEIPGRAFPGAKDALAAYSAAVWSPEGTVPERMKELVFLRTSIGNRCEA